MYRAFPETKLITMACFRHGGLKKSTIDHRLTRATRAGFDLTTHVLGSIRFGTFLKVRVCRFHVGPCRSMLVHVGPCWSMLVHVGLPVVQFRACRSLRARVRIWIEAVLILGCLCPVVPMRSRSCFLGWLVFSALGLQVPPFCIRGRILIRRFRILGA